MHKKFKNFKKMCNKTAEQFSFYKFLEQLFTLNSQFLEILGIYAKLNLFFWLKNINQFAIPSAIDIA